MTTFVKITNSQVYDELGKLKEQNRLEHAQIMGLIVGYKSQVSRLNWAVMGCLGLTGALIVATLSKIII